MAPTKYHRLPAGERCEECGARQWYSEDALRYCRNGHRLEGFAEHDTGEDDFGAGKGRVHRAPKVRRKRIAIKLRGRSAVALYIECLQVILRHQVAWLLRERGAPAELEAVVKALWELRVRDVPLSIVGEETVRAGQLGAESGNDLGTGSSGASEDDFMELSNAGSESNGRRRWGPEPGRRRMPRLVETLGLCYLGCLTLCLPVATADFCGWAQRGDILFLTAIYKIPKHVLDRLPPDYHRALQVHDHIKPGLLQSVAQELAITYNLNYEIVFPPLNYVPILVENIKELTLPVEIYLVVKCLIRILEIEFKYPKGDPKRLRPIDNPETLLLGLIAVATKILHPMDGVSRPPVDGGDPRGLQIDWTVWAECMSKKSKAKADGLEPGTEFRVSGDDAFQMSEAKMDDYMNWFEKTWIGPADDPKTPARIRDLFKTSQETPRADAAPQHHSGTGDLEEDAMRKRYCIVNSTMKSIAAQADPPPTGKRTAERLERDFCPMWPTVEDLPEAAEIFYTEVAKVGAIPLETLVAATAQVERKLEVWNKEQTRRRKTAKSDEEEDDMGKELYLG